jgi:hypothetical protein
MNEYSLIMSRADITLEKETVQSSSRSKNMTKLMFGPNSPLRSRPQGAKEPISGLFKFLMDEYPPITFHTDVVHVYVS